MSRAQAHKGNFPSSAPLLPFKLITVTLIAVALWLLINIGSIREFLDVYDQRNRAREQVDTLGQSIRILGKQRRDLLNYGFETERQARERLQLKKPGEGVIYLKPGTTENMIRGANASTTETAAPPTPPAQTQDILEIPSN